MKNVLILGSRGYTVPYGGWETFVHGLIDNWHDQSVIFHVFEIVDNISKEGIITIDGINIIRIHVKPRGSIDMMVFDAKCTAYAIKYIKENRLENPIMYYLGLRIGPLMLFKRHQIKKQGVIIMENPAGLEWKRTKWSFLVRWYTRIAAWCMAKSVDFLICDSQAMVDVYGKIVKSKRLVKRYISYGSYPAPELSEMPEKVRGYFDRFGIKPNKYYLDVSRFVPENNYEYIVSEYLKTKTDKDLVLVTNIDKEKSYFDSFQNEIAFQADNRVKFVGSVYDRDIVNYLRHYAYGYINGHTLGGTNPGLLESMSITDLNLVYDVVFAREVGGDAVVYFDRKNLLSEAIEVCESMSDEERAQLGLRAKARMDKYYRWNHIVTQYEKLFNEVTQFARIKEQA